MSVVAPTQPPARAEAGRGGLVVIAVGGNALIADDEHESIVDQQRLVEASAPQLADIVAAGWRVVIVHGNGPQVGFILRRAELAIHEVPPVPMDYATADTQGAIGYMFQRALDGALRVRSIDRSCATVVTQVLVDADDPAMANPTKPIGSFMGGRRARDLAAEHGWTVVEDAGRGWRRVVPSPEPRAILEVDAIAGLVEAGFVVVACGGGGIPVLRTSDGYLHGVEAVIDKDRTASLLARALDADVFVISTAVPRVAVDFGRPSQRWLERVTAAELVAYHADAQFPPGSMGPKVDAVLSYLDAGGRQAVITDLDHIGPALAGEAGTIVTRDEPSAG